MTALNVNVPKFVAGASAALPWSITKFGNFDYITPQFVTDIGATPIGVSLGLGNVHLPGVVIVNHNAEETTRQTDKKSEALQMLKGKITVTPMQFGYEVQNDDFQRLESELARALNK